MTLAIDQRRIDSGNELVKPIMKKKFNNVVYFSQLEYIFFYMDYADFNKVVIYSENYIK
jgi:hypothetical protein